MSTAISLQEGNTRACKRKVCNHNVPTFPTSSTRFSSFSQSPPNSSTSTNKTLCSQQASCAYTSVTGASHQFTRAANAILVLNHHHLKAVNNKVIRNKIFTHLGLLCLFSGCWSLRLDRSSDRLIKYNPSNKEGIIVSILTLFSYSRVISSKQKVYLKADKIRMILLISHITLDLIRGTG